VHPAELVQAAEAAGFPMPLNAGEAAALELADDEDLALANACLQLEWLSCRTTLRQAK
jgi:hypothetical protein